MGQLFSYFYAEEIPSPNPEDTVIKSELIPSEFGSIDQHGLAYTEGIDPEKSDGDSCETNVGPSCVSGWSPETASETERDTSPDTMEIPSPNPEDTVIKSELIPSEFGSIDQHGLAYTEGIDPEKSDGDSCETNVGPSCVSGWSPETASETERGTSPDTMGIPSSNPEDTVTKSELIPSEFGSIDQHGLAYTEGIEPKRRDGESCETNVGPSCVSIRSPETASETERGTSPDTMGIPSPNPEDTVIKSELKPSEIGSIDQHGLAYTAEGIDPERSDGDSCETNVGPSCVSVRSPETGSETDIGTSPETMGIPSPNPEDTVIKSELKPSEIGSIDQHGLAYTAEGIDPERSDGDSCETNVGPSCVSVRSPETGSETDIGTSPETMGIPSPNPEDTVIKSELKTSENGSIDQHGLAYTEGIEPERRDGESCETNVGPSCVSIRSPETASETARVTCPDTMSPTTTEATEHLKDAESINIWVKCSGKSEEMYVFPLERVSVLLEDSCREFGKNPKKMMLIYNGEKMDEKKKVEHYSLRGGATVQLIRPA